MSSERSAHLQHSVPGEYLISLGLNDQAERSETGNFNNGSFIQTSKSIPRSTSSRVDSPSDLVHLSIFQFRASTTMARRFCFGEIRPLGYHAGLMRGVPFLSIFDMENRQCGGFFNPPIPGAMVEATSMLADYYSELS